MNKKDIQKTPANYIYIFVNDNFLSLVAKYISPTAAQTIKAKRTKQLKVLTNPKIYGSYAEVVKTGYNELSGWIFDAWGYTPQEILKKLLAGQECAGKNWAKGIYGIGKTQQNAWTGNSDLYVDTATGNLISRSGVTVGEPVNIYNNKGGIIGKTYTVNGSNYSVNYVNNGWYAGAMGNKEGMFNPDGSVFTGADSSSIWESVQSSMSYFSGFLEWLFKLLGIDKSKDRETITAQNTIPSQGELSTRVTKKDNSDGLLLLGGIGLAAYLFLGKK